MIEVIVRGDKPEEVEQMIIFCSGVPTEDTLDQVRSDYMGLHQNLMRVEKEFKVPSYDATYEIVKRILKEIDDKKRNTKSRRSGSDKV